MKVECIQLLNERTGLAEDYSYWLTLGGVYHVLCLFFYPNGKMQVRLLGKEKNTPALFDLRQFKIVSPAIPPGWVLVSYQDGSYQLSPQPWVRTGFWEEFFDRQPEAARVFEAERTKIIAFDP